MRKLSVALLLVLMTAFAFGQVVNMTVDNLYAPVQVQYFAYTHIDSSNGDTTSIATPGTWYQMQGTIHHSLLGFTKTTDGLQYNGNDSLQFKSVISLSVKSSRARTIVMIGASINGESPHTVMPVYCYYSNQWYPVTCPDAWQIKPTEKARVVITANKTTNVIAGSGGITFEPTGKK